MKQVKPVVILSILLFVAILIIPSLLVLPFTPEEASGKLTEKEQGQQNQQTADLSQLLKEASTLEVAVYRSKKDEVELLPLESYIVGVVASEMPADFEIEALKAQSLAARTYIIKQLMADQKVALLKGADVSDTENHQVYSDLDELKEKWGLDFKKNLEKIQTAVYETRGQIIVYENKPITASYFSTSNGYTENSEAYWINEFPYLKSVESPWDLESKEYLAETVIKIAEFEELLGVKVSGDQVGEILSYTPGNRVGEVQIGDKVLSGREVREALKLRSSDFSWEVRGDEMVITTEGYGHGIGMSQYGANGMAKEGKTYEEIIKYYYNGVDITEASPFIDQYIVKK